LGFEMGRGYHLIRLHDAEYANNTWRGRYYQKPTIDIRRNNKPDIHGGCHDKHDDAHPSTVPLSLVIDVTRVMLWR
jgi:hypothetical protein